MSRKPNPIQDRNETYVTIKEAGEYLRISSRTVYRWLTQGKLKCFQVGSTTRILLSDLDRFIAENTGQPTQESD